MPLKYYYFIEDLDVTDDNIPDGVLIRQFSINQRTNTINYTKNNYITVNKLKEILVIDDDKKHKPILLSNKIMNDIKNRNIELNSIPRIIIGKKSFFADLLHTKNINMNKFLINLNKLF
jgi:3-methyladenine DNA glycosylase Mpg